VIDDDGTNRTVRVERVEPGRGVRFTWWPSDGPDRCSTVELVVLPTDQGSRLRVTEVLASASSAVTSLRWEMRALALWACVACLASV
jgi:uncharacterized protein YndB with AHSA1/START domain